MSPTVERYFGQRRDALKAANEIRLARAALKRRIARGEIPAIDVILDPPVEAATWPIMDVLMSQRRWGRERAFKLLHRAEIPEAKPVGALTERQRMQLATFLGYRANGASEEGVGDGS